MKMLRRILKKADSCDSLARDPADTTPRYPPLAEGVQYVHPSELIKSQHALLMRLRIAIGVSPEMFDAYYQPVIINYADYVQLLPASESHHHRGVGGLLRHGLEVAWNAAEIYSGVVMNPEQSSEKRRELEPQWRLAVFVAALCHDVGKAAYDITVTDGQGSLEWDPGLSTLGSWLKEHQIARYYIHWARTRKHNSHNLFSLTPLSLILCTDVSKFLSRGVREAMQHAMLGLDESASNAQTIRDIVKRADSLSVESDLKTCSDRVMSDSVTVPVTRHVVDAMNRLITSRVWRINKPGGRVWISQQGVFIVWKKAVEEIIEILSDDNILGIPRDIDVLAGILREQDIIKPYIDEEGHETLYWPITPTLNTQTACLRMQAVCIRSFELISNQPPPFYCDLKIPGYDIDVNDKSECQVVSANSRAENEAQTTTAESLLSGLEPIVEAREVYATGDTEPDVACYDASAQVQGMERTVLPDVLHHILESLRQENALEGTCLYENGRVFLLYPACMSHLDKKPADALSEIADCLYVDPAAPLVKTHTLTVNEETVTAIIVDKPYDAVIASDYLNIEIDAEVDRASIESQTTDIMPDRTHELVDKQDIIARLRKWLMSSQVTQTGSGDSVLLDRGLLNQFCENSGVSFRDVVACLNNDAAVDAVKSDGVTMFKILMPYAK